MDAQHLVCGNCEAKLKAPASLPAGKKVRCPQCGNAVVVPERESHPAVASGKKSCPFCGESIQANAVKCRFCNEFLDAETPAAAKAVARAPRRGGAVDMTPAEYIVAVVFAPIGLIIGIVWKFNRSPKAAEMIKVSGLMCVILAIAPLIYMQYFKEKKVKGPLANTERNLQAELEAERRRVENEADEDPPERRRSPAAQPPIAAPDPKEIERLPKGIQRAMRASVVVLAGRGNGSGVVVQRDGNLGLVLTNRHVVDMVYFQSQGVAQTSASQIPLTKVKFVNNEDRIGKVVWLAGEIDLALIEVALPKEADVADWLGGTDTRVGDEVFAVGSPLGYSWTYTKGTVSAFRDHQYGGKKVPVVQTDARIEPGNSGGGLFAKSGELIGINTFVARSSRETAGETGLGFAIRKSLIGELKPDMLKLSMPKR